jgi:hypothetical protein
MAAESVKLHNCAGIVLTTPSNHFTRKMKTDEVLRNNLANHNAVTGTII